MIRKLLIPAFVFLLIIAACKNDPAAKAAGDQSAAPVSDTLSKTNKETSPYQRLDVQAFEENVIRYKNIPIIDIRSEADFKKGHMYRAINWPYDTTGTFASRFESLDRKAPIAMYCQSGYFSQQAGMQLLGKGFQKIYILKGGLLVWMSEGKTLSAL
jgi:rhodanese-related sulfurtransferase